MEYGLREIRRIRVTIEGPNNSQLKYSRGKYSKNEYLYNTCNSIARALDRGWFSRLIGPTKCQNDGDRVSRS